MNFAKALEHGRKAIEIYPETYKYRANYALYAMYAGGLPDRCHNGAGAHQGRPEDGRGISAAGDGSADLGRSRARRATYVQAAGAGESGASGSGIGLADVAMYEGQYAEAIASLPAAARRDEDQGNAVGAAAKLVALAEAHAAQNESASREAAIARARKQSEEDGVRCRRPDSQ